MNIYKTSKRIFLLYFSFWFVDIHAQNNKADSTIILKTFTISSERLYDFSSGQKVITLDSSVLKQYAFQNISDLIIQHTLANVKTYGSSMLSNIGIRGNASNQTGVFWNGININSANIGMTDFSLLPAFFFDKVEMQYGGGSSLFGSGCIGGSFHFFNDPIFNKKSEVNLSLSKASYNDISAAAKVVFSNVKFYSATSAFYKNALNDFEYINEAKFGMPVEKMKNAAVLSKGLLQDFAYKINKNQKISVSAWGQNNYRQIPGTMTTDISNAKQYDQTIRSVLNWDMTTENNKIYIKVAGIFEDQHFTDSIVHIDSRLKITNQISEIGFSQKINKNIKIEGGINNTLSIADIQAYNGLRKQNKTSFFLSYNHFILPIDWLVQFSIRYDLIKGIKIPLPPSLGLEGRIWRFFYGKIYVSKNYRIPTLNDMFWQPGGNPDLKSEESYNQEASLSARYSGKSFFKKAEISLTAYHTIINNCIEWLPTENVYWAPQNIRKMRSEGVEAEAKAVCNINKFDVTLNSSYSYTSIMNSNQISVFDESFEKQLIYVPYHKVLFNINCQYKNINLTFNDVYTGKRFTSVDNTKMLPYFNLSLLSISHILHYWGLSSESSFKIDNLLNIEYQIIQWRPMPGRNYRVGLNFNFNSNK